MALEQNGRVEMIKKRIKAFRSSLSVCREQIYEPYNKAARERSELIKAKIEELKQQKQTFEEEYQKERAASEALTAERRQASRDAQIEHEEIKKEIEEVQSIINDPKASRRKKKEANARYDELVPKFELSRIKVENNYFPETSRVETARFRELENILYIKGTFDKEIHNLTYAMRDPLYSSSLSSMKDKYPELVTKVKELDAKMKSSASADFTFMAESRLKDLEKKLSFNNLTVGEVHLTPLEIASLEAYSGHVEIRGSIGFAFDEKGHIDWTLRENKRALLLPPMVRGAVLLDPESISSLPVEVMHHFYISGDSFDNEFEAAITEAAYEAGADKEKYPTFEDWSSALKEAKKAKDIELGAYKEAKLESIRELAAKKGKKVNEQMLMYDAPNMLLEEEMDAEIKKVKAARDAQIEEFYKSGKFEEASKLKADDSYVERAYLTVINQWKEEVRKKMAEKMSGQKTTTASQLGDAED